MAPEQFDPQAIAAQLDPQALEALKEALRRVKQALRTVLMASGQPDDPRAINEFVGTMIELIVPCGLPFFPREMPAHVYHYTTAEGLYGILSSGRLWATNILYLNDATEMTYVDRLLGEAVAELAPGDPTLNDIFQLLTLNPTDSGLKVFAACFCEKADLLSQWRAYGRNGVGYAVQFSWPELQKKCVAANYVSGRIEYDSSIQKAVVRRLTMTFRERLRKNRAETGQLQAAVGAEPSNTEKNIAEITANSAIGPVGGALTMLTLVRAFLKSPVFSEEREWRAVAFRTTIKDRDVTFRCSEGLLVPYTALDLQSPDGELPIDRIIVGPSHNPIMAKRSLQDFLDSKGLGRIAVEGSEIPLRV